MNKNMTAESGYLNIVRTILNHGEKRKTRGGAITRTWFSPPKILMTNVMDNFPLLTTKKMALRIIFEELMFFIRGQTNVKKLIDKKVNIWSANTSAQNIEKLGLPLEEHDMGPMYGFQWRHCGAKYTGCNTDYTGQGFDQLQYCIDLIKTDPTSRRIVMTTWSPTDLLKGVLAPCHGTTVQFFVHVNEGGQKSLDLFHHQRSGDMALGVPYNMASYGLLLILVASVTDCMVGSITFSIGDAHVYEQHVEKLTEQCNLTPMTLPKIRLNQTHDNIEKYNWEDICLENYYPGKKIAYEFVL